MSIAPPYVRLSQYCETSFGLLRFAPPLSATLPYLHERRNDPPILYEFSYNSLLGVPRAPDSVNNTPYASIRSAYNVAP